MAEPATQAVAASPTVRAVLGKLGDEPCSAGQLIGAILERHRSDYAGGHAEAIAVEWPEASRRAAPAEWLREVRGLLSPETHAELHGRAVILAASLADPVTGRAVVASGLFQALADELRPTLYESLTDAGRARLKAIPIATAIAGSWSKMVDGGEPIDVVALSPSGALVALGHADGHLTVIDRQRKAAFRYPESAGGVTALTYFRDGTRLATGHAGGRVTVSGPLGDPVLEEIEVEVGEPVSGLRFDPGGSGLVATTPRGAVVSLDPGAGTQFVAESRGASPLVAIGRDGLQAAWVDEGGGLKVGSPKLVDPVLEWAPERPGLHALALSPDGALLAAGHDSAAGVYSADGRVMHPTQTPVTGLAFSRDGTRLAVATQRGERYVVDPAGAGSVELPSMPDVRGICFTPDGRWVAMVSGYGMRLDDVRTGEAVLHLESDTFMSLDVSWDRLVMGAAGGSLVSIPIGLEPAGARGIAAYSADGVDVADDLDAPLDIDEDVMAFASLIASTKVQPPLSIGLFGDWGSGKTFFMQRLMRRVERLSLETRATDSLQKDAPFHKRIAQVQFNAWHYAEGNLWASLVQHLLDNLALPEEPVSAMEARRRDIVQRIAEQEQAVEVSDRDAKELEHAVEHLKVREGKLRGEASDSEAEARQLAGSDALTRAPGAVLGARQALIDAGWPAGAQTLEELAVAVGDASDVLRRGSLLHGRDAPRPRWLIAFLVAAPLLSLLLGVALVLFGASALFATVATVASTATAVLGVATAIVRTQLGWARTRIERLETARAALETARREHEARLAEARRAAAVARERAQAARRDREKLQNELEHLRPERLLDDLLAKRLKSGAYRRHLGLLELVRSDFETITEYLAEKARESERDSTAEDKDTGITRIVLYIDDLDRCEPARVVEVLKAVHLLLAMKLFVVVVGVDVRWVSGALEQRHDLLGGERRATSRDYLEKIFQIPFWIEPLDPSGSKTMLGQLLGVAAGGTPDARVPVRQARPPVQEAGNGAGNGQAPPLPGAPAAAAQGDAPPPPSSSPDGGELPPLPPEARPEQLEIGELERGFMDELAPLLGRSPRALKRFVNTYRLFKAREPDYAAFLSEVPDTPGNSQASIQPDVAGYRAVLFVLAIATGLPTLGAAFLDEVLDGTPGTVIETVDRIADRQPDEAARLREWLESEDVGDWRDVPVDRLRARAAEAARFTFHWRGAPAAVRGPVGP